MSGPRDRRHVVLRTSPNVAQYRPWRHPTEAVQLPQLPAGVRAHADALRASVTAAQAVASQRRKELDVPDVERKPDGITLVFESFPGFELALKPLENERLGIELLAVVAPARSVAEPQVQRATVFVPDAQVKYFLKRIDEFANNTTKRSQAPLHQNLVQRVASIRLATLRQLWTDADDAYPKNETAIWWEVWLRRRDDRECQRLEALGAHAGFRVGPGRIAFDDRTVVLVHATAAQLAFSGEVLGDIAEVRLAKESTAFFAELDSTEEAAWVLDLARRLVPASRTSPAVCLLDTGVTRGHPLLAPSLDAQDMHTCDIGWGVDDRCGHGTQMAGLALLGDLTQLLAGQGMVTASHGLESVKVLRRPGDPANPPDLWGRRTAEGSCLAEIAAPERVRTFLMTVSSTDTRDRGVPTSWSATVDALAAGRSFDFHSGGLDYLEPHEEARGRLFVLAAGNVDDGKFDADHVAISDLEVVHDPAHAWNALTVGAYTRHANIAEATYAGWRPVARPDDLSPYSSTSVSFSRPWPIKPDVVFEGGNLAHDGKIDFRPGLPSLSLLTTYYRPSVGPTVVTCMTSAAAAQVARMAARLQVEYPEFWPETVRGLIVSSARWTSQMRAHLPADPPLRARENLVRRFGFGVPDEGRAARSARDALTLVRQCVIRPFLAARGSDSKLREIHLHELPWPKKELAQLAELPVELRVTLSYFIEPNPGRRGWELRHSYASHGLRFEVKGEYESIDEFHARLNEFAHDEETERPKAKGAGRNWFLGAQVRHRGSLHSDIWTGTAADLAERGVIAVYPVSGWWKALPKRDRSEVGARYALIVSIETPDVGLDIWTPVAQQVGIDVVT